MARWTEGRLKSFITSTIRSGFRRWPEKYEALNKAKVGKKVNEATGRLAEHYRCAGCLKDFVVKDVQVNHIETVVPLTGFSSWDDFISRLFCSSEKLNVLCIPCHKKITKEENTMRKSFKDKAEKTTYQSWLDMKSRCFNKNNQRYYTHGGRGITVCDEWKDSFDVFLSDMGYKPEGYSLDRIDNDGNYEKGNCKWSTPKEQALNRRTNIWVSFQGDTLSVSQWAEVVGISFSAMKKRLSRWPLDKALCKTMYNTQEVPLDIKEEILERCAKGESQGVLAEEFGISQSGISKWVVMKRSTKEEN